MDADLIVTTRIISPGHIEPMATRSCSVCIATRISHTVVSSVTTTGPTETPTFFTENGLAHHHSWKQEIRVYQCSNGHTYADRLIIECPACGWTIDRDIADS